MIFRALTRSHLVLRIIQSTVSDGYAMRWDDGNGSTYFSPRKRSLKCLQSFLSFPFCVPLFRSTQYSKCYGQNGIFSSSFGSKRFSFLSRKPGCANGTVVSWVKFIELSCWLNFRVGWWECQTTVCFNSKLQFTFTLSAFNRTKFRLSP